MSSQEGCTKEAYRSWMIETIQAAKQITKQTKGGSPNRIKFGGSRGCYKSREADRGGKPEITEEGRT